MGLPVRLEKEVGWRLGGEALEASEMKVVNDVENGDSLRPIRARIDSLTLERTVLLGPLLWPLELGMHEAA